MKKILLKKILSIVFMAAMLLSIIDISMIYAANADNTQNIQIILRTKYLFFDRQFNGHRIQINISSNTQGNVAYMEEYYVIDSNGNPRMVNSGRYYDGPLTNNFISFEILRPKKGANDYSMIKGIVLIDGQRIFEPWITSSATYKYGVNGNSSSSSVKKIKPDIQKRVAPFSAPTATEKVQSTDTAVQKTADGKLSLITIVATSIVYIFVRNKKRN